jgi:hypothetical protein
VSDLKEKEKVIEKIRKLFAMSDSGSINEAAIAAQKAQQLMSEYGISAGDFMTALSIYTTKKVPVWQQILAYAIADLYGVVILRHEDCLYEDIDIYGDYSLYQYSIKFIGDEIYATVAHEMFIYLRDAIKRLSIQVKGRSAKDSFCKGAAGSVVDKLNNMGTDAAWITQKKRRFLQACDYSKNTLTLEVPQAVNARYRIEKQSYEKGQSAGNTISLNRQAGGISPQLRIKGN